MHKRSKIRLLAYSFFIASFIVFVGYLYSGAFNSWGLRQRLTNHRIVFETRTLEIFDVDTQALMHIDYIRIDNNSTIDQEMLAEVAQFDWLHHLEIRCDQNQWDKIADSTDSILPVQIKKITIGNHQWFEPAVTIDSPAFLSKEIVASGCRLVKLVGVDLANSDIDLAFLIENLNALSLCACTISNEQNEILDKYKSKQQYRDKIIITERGSAQ